MRSRLRAWAAAAALWAAAAASGSASPIEQARESVVSVLPQRAAAPSPATDRGLSAPEGSGVAIGGGDVIATAWHVIAGAERVEVRLHDGRVLPAEVLGHDPASDIALLKIEDGVPPFAIEPSPALGAPVCAIGNAFGLGLSVSCGVVSAKAVSAAGFNAVEDFVQTDAAANPGSSGGALVDRSGRLVGMVSAIFASKGDGDIGVNFAVSAPLLIRVARDLQTSGRVDYVAPGWRLGPQPRELRARIAGAAIETVAADGPAARAGFEKGDVILQVGARRIRKPRDATAALALTRVGDSVEVGFLRGRRNQTKTLTFDAASLAPPPTAPPAPARSEQVGAACPHPPAVCAARRFVFPVSSFNPLASAVRIGPDLLVTNRHVIGDRVEAAVMTPSGPLTARVEPSAYEGDLALLQVAGLPEDWPIAALDEGTGDAVGPFYAVGADPRLRETRVFTPGGLLRPPAKDASLGRLHVAAVMRPGVSGGALVDGAGRLVGVATGGGEGRYEAIPAAELQALLALRENRAAAKTQKRLGEGFARCADGIARLRASPRGTPIERDLDETCLQAKNLGQLLEAGRAFAGAGAVKAAIELHEAAVEQSPNSANARLSLLTSLQLAGRFDDMIPHARWMFDAEPQNPQALRFAIQSGVWGDEPDLAEAAYNRLLAVDPRQAGAARRFIDAPPPAPRER